MTTQVTPEVDWKLAATIDELAIAYRAQFKEEPSGDVSILSLGPEDYLRRMRLVMKTGDTTRWYEGIEPLEANEDI